MGKFDFKQYVSKHEGGKVNEWAVGEIDLWIDNNEQMLRRRESWENNFARKMKKGTFDRTVGVGALAKYLVTEAVKHYNSQGFGEKIILNHSEKLNVAEGQMDRIEQEIEGKDAQTKFKV